MDEANRKVILEKIDAMLQDPTVNINIRRGMHRRANLATGYWEYEPTNGMTITIIVHGAAVETEENPTEATSRLLASMQGSTTP